MMAAMMADLMADQMAGLMADLTESWIKMVTDLVHPMVPSS